jgi:hypothetical protein
VAVDQAQQVSLGDVVCQLEVVEQPFRLRMFPHHRQHPASLKPEDQGITWQGLFQQLQFLSVHPDLTESWWITPTVRQTERVPEHAWFVGRLNMP